MTDPTTVDPSRIDDYVKRELNDAGDPDVPLVRDVLAEPGDRWYGQLVGHAYASLADPENFETVLPAAAGVELLRGYVRLRSRLLVTLADRWAHSFTLEKTPALLGGDYLYTAAFSSLQSVPDAHASDCMEILTTVLESITEAFAVTYTPTGSPATDHTTFFDETAGSLGSRAAALGTTLAGLDDRHRRHFERFGRGLSTARQIELVLEADPSDAMVVPPSLDESRLRRHAERRRDDVDQALSALAETADETRLRAFAEPDDPPRDLNSAELGEDTPE